MNQLALIGFELIFPLANVGLVFLVFLSRHRATHSWVETEQVQKPRNEEELKGAGTGYWEAAESVFLVLIVFFGLLFISLFLAIFIVVGAFAASLVYHDARNRGDSSSGTWALGTFLLPIVVLPLYFYYHRAHDRSNKTTLPRLATN